MVCGKKGELNSYEEIKQRGNETPLRFIHQEEGWGGESPPLPFPPWLKRGGEKTNKRRKDSSQIDIQTCFSFSQRETTSKAGEEKKTRIKIKTKYSNTELENSHR